MTRDDIIRIALEAGGCTPELDDFWELNEDALVRFAALVVAAEKQKVVEYMNSRAFATGHGDTIDDLLKELEWQVAEREREACAKLFDGEVWAYDYREIAAAIRARGEQEQPR